MLDPSVDYSADFGTPPPQGITSFVTAGGIAVTRKVTPFQPGVLADVTRQADIRRGGTFSSGMEYPGRYSRWHMGYIDPCVEFAACGRELTATALNERGTVLLPVIEAALARAGQPEPSDSAGGARQVRVVIGAGCSGPSATTWRSSSSRSGYGPAGTTLAGVTTRSAISSCTCPTSST